LGDDLQHPLSDSLLALLVNVVGDLLHLGDGFGQNGGVGLRDSLDELAHGLVVAVGELALGAGPALSMERRNDDGGEEGRGGEEEKPAKGKEARRWMKGKGKERGRCAIKGKSSASLTHATEPVKHTYRSSSHVGEPIER
jgi:hypothetical protein